MAAKVFCRTLCHKVWQIQRSSVNKHCWRGLLSEAYRCSDAWNHRMSTPLLQKVDISDLAIKVQEKFDKEGKASAVDMDILANKLEQADPIQLDFMQNLFSRFRRTSDCVQAEESTHHAIVRAFLKLGETTRLLDILRDKVNYGLFLDDYTANILLDHFIETKDYQAAVQVAYDQMLQEDLSHPLTRQLAWYACLMHHKHSPQPEAAEEPVTEEDEEDKYIRVRFIVNPWFDDHFDLDKDTLLLGKTLTMIAGEQADTVGLSTRLLGLGLWEKFPLGLDLIKQVLAGEGVLAKEVVESFRKSLEEVRTKEDPNVAEMDLGSVTLEDVRPFTTQEDKERYLTQLQELSQQLQDKDKLVADELDLLVKDNLQNMITVCEPKDKTALEELYSQWETRREHLVQEQIKQILNEQKKKDIESRLKKLKATEEKLRYFEEQDRISVGIMRAPKVTVDKEVGVDEQYVKAPGERSGMLG